MMLTVRGLPPDIIVSDIRLIIQQQCGVSRVLVDELTEEAGGTASVTIGCLDADDFGKVLRVLDGAKLDSFMLTAAPYRPDQDNGDCTSNGNMEVDNEFEPVTSAPTQRGNRIPPWKRTMQNQIPNTNVFGFGASSQAVNSGNVPPWQEERQDLYERRIQQTTMELHQPDYRDRSPLAPRDLRRSCSPTHKNRGQRSAREPPPPPFRQRPNLGRRPGDRSHLPGLKRRRSPSPIGSLSFGRHREAKFAHRDPFPQGELARLQRPEFHATNLGSPFEMQHASSSYISPSPLGTLNPFRTSRLDSPLQMDSPPRQFSEPHYVSGPPIGTFNRTPISGFPPLGRIRRTPFSESTPSTRSVPRRIQSQHPATTSTMKGGRAIVVNKPTIVGNLNLPNMKLASWIPEILYEMIGSKPIIKSGIKEKYSSLIQAFEEALLARVREMLGTSKPVDVKHLIKLYRAKFPPSGDRPFLLAVSDQLGLPIPNTVDEMLSESPWSEPLKIGDKIFDEARAHAASVLTTRLLKPGATGKSEIPQEEKKVYRYLRTMIGSRMAELTVDPTTKMIQVSDLLKLYRSKRTAASDRELIDLAIAEHNLKNPTILYKGQFKKEVGEKPNQVADTTSQVLDVSSQDGETSSQVEDASSQDGEPSKVLYMVGPPAAAADFTFEHRMKAAATIALNIILPGAISKNNLPADEKKIYKYMRMQVELRLPGLLSERGMIITAKNIPEVVVLYDTKYTDGGELISNAIARHNAEHPAVPYNGIHKIEKKLAKPTEEQAINSVALQKRKNAAAVIALRLLQPGARGKSDLHPEEKKIYQTVREMLTDRLADVEVACGADQNVLKLTNAVKAYRRKYDANSDMELLDRAISHYNSLPTLNYKGLHAKSTPSVSAGEDSGAPTEVERVDSTAPTLNKEPSVKANLQMLIRKDYAASIIASEVFELNQSKFFKADELSATEKKNALTWIGEIIADRLSALDTEETEKLTSTSAMVRVYREHYPSDTDASVLADVVRDLLCPQNTAAEPNGNLSVSDDCIMLDDRIVMEGGVISDDDAAAEVAMAPEGGVVPDGGPAPEGDQASGGNPLPEECGEPADPLLVKKWIKAETQKLTLRLMGFDGPIGEALRSMSLKQKRIMRRLKDKLRVRIIATVKMSPVKPRAEEDVMRIYRRLYSSDKEQELLKLAEQAVELQNVEPRAEQLSTWMRQAAATLAHRLLYTPERPACDGKAALINKVKAAFYDRCSEVISNAKEKPQNLQEVKELYYKAYSESDNKKTAEDIRQQFIEEMKASVEENSIPPAPQFAVQDNAQFSEDIFVDNLISETQMPVVDLVQSEQSAGIVDTNFASADGAAVDNLTLGAQPPLYPVLYKKKQRLRYKPRRTTQPPRVDKPLQQPSDISIDDIQMNMDDLEDY